MTTIETGADTARTGADFANTRFPNVLNYPRVGALEAPGFAHCNDVRKGGACGGRNGSSSRRRNA